MSFPDQSLDVVADYHQRHLLEVMNVKAHGDGAAQIAIDGLDYSPNSRQLVSVAEGVGSIRLWNVASTGKCCIFALRHIF